MLASVVHQDDSARIQTVRADLNPKYYRLLQQFKLQTGLGVVLNTSFNKRRMPIVETPDDAIKFFLACGLHVLVIEDFMVRKRARKPHWPALAVLFAGQVGQSLERNQIEAARLGGVYQLNIGQVQSRTIDFSGANPQLREGPSETQPDVLMEASDLDFRNMIQTPGEARRLLQDGRLKIVGDLNLAYGLTEILSR